MTTSRKHLGQLLVEDKAITREQCEQALSMQMGGGRRIGKIFLRMGLVTNDQLLKALSRQFNLPIIDISNEISRDNCALLPRHHYLKYCIFPLHSPQNGVLRLAMSDPSDSEAIEYVERITGKAVQPCLATQDDIISAIRQHSTFSWRGFFTPRTYHASGRATSIVIICIIAALLWANYSLYHAAKYGQTIITGQSTIYSHHHLNVEVGKSGMTTLTGHGAHAEGAYNVTFSSIQGLTGFISTQKNNLSQEQTAWLHWVINNR
ncbi:GspE/PulE/PilB domain-containing protein [Desulfogranum japonicum]|uniref:GspE/PulE/PilB domain-containing protein n=1 Tax=Desulfogranum japonicum TaxID=231447 RepID=UPI001377412D|nr:hypothetical protein [Desulfogranum japonicum]